jgi:hypothetical protein
MKKMILLALVCISGQMPQKPSTEVASTKEPVQQEEMSQEPKERVGAAKKILRGLDNAERKGAAQKIRQGI